MKLNLSKNLEPLKEAARVFVDLAAETERGKYITLGSGQAMVYAEKEKEAKAFLAELGPAINYPHLAEEAKARGKLMGDLANEILERAFAWRVMSASIEAKRMHAKKLIDEAANPAQIEAAKVIAF